MSRNVADRLRSLDVTTGRPTPAAEAAVSGRAAEPGRGGAAGMPLQRGEVAERGAGARTPARDRPSRPGRGRPPRHEEPTQQTTIRLTMSEWADLQAQVTRETLARGERRYVVDIIRDAIGEYLARHR